MTTNGARQPRLQVRGEAGISRFHQGHSARCVRMEKRTARAFALAGNERGIRGQLGSGQLGSELH